MDCTEFTSGHGNRSCDHFQPELRRALEKLGEKQFVPNMVALDKRGKDNVRFSQKTIDGIVEASFAMGAVKTGALIVVEQAIMLTEYESTGIALDCIVSPQVLINILNTTHHFMMARSSSVETGSYQRPAIFHCQTIWESVRNWGQDIVRRSE